MRSCVLRLLIISLLLPACAFAPAQSSSPNDKSGADAFSAEIASQILNQLHDGLESHTPQRMLSAFDPGKMNGYPEFENQVHAFFNRYASFRSFFHIVQSSSDGPKGVVLVDIQLEAAPLAPTDPPVRKNAKLRLVLERGRKGWKIVDLSPRDFFS